MALTLYYHPLSSYCMKVLIALYENGTPFTAHLVRLREPAERAEFLKLWPLGKFPVLTDGDRLVPESSIIIEYLDQKHPGRTRFIPAEADAARQMRMRDRFFDLHVMEQMTKIVGDRLRPEGRHDPLGVEEARTRLATALGMADEALAGKAYAFGESFTMADCAAVPSLFYAAKIVEGFGSTYPAVAGYLDRQAKRGSVARTLREAEPYMDLFPKG